MTVTLGIVTGLRLEADLLRESARKANIAPPMIAVAGLGVGAATRAAELLLTHGATHLMSFGLAAGLDPRVPAGMAIIATHLRGAGGTTVIADEGWALDIAGLPGVRGGIIAEAAEILATPHAKEMLAKRSGAVAADMESFAVAQVAAARKVPCAVLRAISDSADQALPPAATVAMGEDGNIRIGRVLTALIRQPGQIGALMRLGASTAKARRNLARLADLGLARSFFADLGNE